MKKYKVYHRRENMSMGGTENFGTYNERKCDRSPHKKESKLKELIKLLTKEYNIS